MAHRRHQARRPDRLSGAGIIGQQPFQFGLDETGRAGEALIEEGGVGHDGSGVENDEPEP